MLSMIGLVGGLLLLIVLTIRGMNLFIAAPLCALVVAITNNIGVFAGDVNFVQTYMSGFSGCIAGGAKASDEKGSAEQFDNPVHGEAAEDS